MKGKNQTRKITGNIFDLSLRDVSFAWPSGTKVLDKCTFSITRPGLWMIVGSNGSGKSTLFRLLSGMIKPQTGQINCSFKPALMFQNPDHQLLLPTCRSDLMLSIPRHLSNREREDRINNVLERVDLGGMANRSIHTLSGGQKQRLALAGALASESDLLLLDEPTALLDPISQKSVLDIVKQLSRCSHSPITSLWITHRLEELDFCDGAAQMEKGRISDWKTGKEVSQRLKPLAVRRL